MDRKNIIMILAAAAAIGIGTLLVADSVSFVLAKGGSNAHAYSQSYNKPLQLKGCIESHLPQCDLVVW